MMMLLMPNLNPATKTKTPLLVILLLLCFFTINNAFALIELELPEEFKSTSINSKALSKNFEFTADETTVGTAQNFVLDKTGIILHLKPIPKLKTNNSSIRLINNNFEDVTLYSFKEDSFFAIANPEESYTIIQENIIDCNELINTLGVESKNTLCPESISFKVAENISITEDKSFRVNTNSETQSFLLTAILDENTININNDDFKIVSINSNSALPESINTFDALNLGNLCIKSTKHSKKIIASNCTFDNNKVQTIVKFKNNFSNLDLSTNGNTFNIVFPFPKRLFNKLDHKLILEIKEDVQAKVTAQEINEDSLDQFLFEGHNATFNSNLSEIPKSITKINKNIFNITEPVSLNKKGEKITFNLLKDETEAIIKPFTDQNQLNILTLLNISGNNTDSTNSFNISLSNNIKLKNEEEPENESLNRFQTTTEGNIKITTYLPSDTYNINTERIYSTIEQNIAPSVNNEGKAIEIVNVKARVDLTFNKEFSGLELPSSIGITELALKKPSKIIEKENDFSNQFTISGFLTPPDFRPLAEPDYRATISFSRIFPNDEESFSFKYSELKTKDEVAFTNFFKFLFLPGGVYNAVLEFNGNREALFKN